MNTEYRCGHCGNALTEAELDGGTCPHCGAQISPFGDVVQPPPKSPEASDWPSTFLEPTVEAPPLKTKFPTRPVEDPAGRLDVIRASRTTGRLAPLTPTTPPRSATMGLMLGIGIAIALVLACTIAATGTLLNGLATAKGARVTPTAHQVATPAPTATYGGLGFATQPPNITPIPFTGEIPTPEPTSTPYGGIPTPTPLPTTSGPAQLSVSPLAWVDHCKADHVPTFTLTNSGGGQLTWTATTTDPGVVFAPTTGTLTGGGPPTDVTVSVAPAGHGTITFTDITDGNAATSVTFLCD